MPPLSRALAPFERAFDWDEAERSGRVTLTPGADAALDEADAGLAAAGQGLEAWRADARRGLGAGGAVAFVAAARDTHLVEVPDSALPRVPRDWVKQSTRKGFTRFSAPALARLKAARADAAAAREAALAGVLRGLIDRLLSQAPVFAAAAEAAATLDALISLAAWAEEVRCSGGGCTPDVRARAAGEPAMLRARQLRHPCASQLGGGGGGGGGCFVPNDVSLGGACAPVVVLTGPNMGGKSTLLRTVCLAALLAHIGADVPAAAFECTAMDALFVRMGANDDLAGGRSTFAVELLEASAVLRRATDGGPGAAHCGTRRPGTVTPTSCRRWWSQ
jgi:DNA mismatch repair protein MSH6